MVLVAWGLVRVHSTLSVGTRKVRLWKLRLTAPNETFADPLRKVAFPPVPVSRWWPRPGSRRAERVVATPGRDRSTAAPVLRFASALRVTDRTRRGKGLSGRFGEDCGRFGRFSHQSDGERSAGKGARGQGWRSHRQRRREAGLRA